MGRAKIGDITRGQIRAIHTYRRKLGYGDDAYRYLLKTQFDVLSCKQLNAEEAGQLIAAFRRAAIETGVVQDKPLRYEELEGREGYATPAQLRKIEAMWNNVSVMKTPREKEAALRKYIEKFGASDLRWVTAKQARSIITSLQNFGIKDE